MKHLRNILFVALAVVLIPAGIVFVLGAHEGQVLDTCHVVGVGAVEVTARIAFRVERNQRTVVCHF